MQGTIAQIIAFTTYGNAFISDAPGISTSSFYPGNTTFMFCEYVKFVDLRRQADVLAQELYAPDPTIWLNRLREDGVYAIRIAYMPKGGQKLGTTQLSDRMSVGFVGGGGRWILEAIKADGSDHWEARWEVGDRERADRKIWRVTYGRIANNQRSLTEENITLEEIKAKLQSNLMQMAEFARLHRLEGFAKAFESGLSVLRSQDPYKDVHHADIAPGQFLSSSAAQLLGASQAAWVFGGMGSWNDLVFNGDDQLHYERLSEELYLLLNAAIVAAANSCVSPRAYPSRKKWWRLWK